MRLFNTVTGIFLGDYPGDAAAALDAYARDVGWRSWRLWVAGGSAPVGELALVDGAGEAVYL